MIDTQERREALSQIEDALNDAYQSAGQECCGHGYGECCGNPEPVWDAADQKIMDVLGPVQRALSDAVSQADAQTAEIARLREAQTWRPIETAPQGQIALFYDANATEVRGCMFVDWMVDDAFCGNRHHVATHWMPLPAARDTLQEKSNG